MTLIDVIVAKEPLGSDALKLRALANRLGDDTKIEFQRIGQRTMIAALTESDGWETIGVAHILYPADFDLVRGSLTALEDAVRNLGKGRFFDRSVDRSVCEEPIRKGTR